MPPSSSYRINRNIVECKDNYIIYIILILIVLIETLWNVKLSAVLSVSILPEGINRNIVECKDFYHF